MSQIRKSFLLFSQTERQGLFLLSLLILAVCWAPLLLSYLLPPEPSSLEAFVSRTTIFLSEKPNPGKNQNVEGGYDDSPGSNRTQYPGASYAGQREAAVVTILEVNAADSAGLSGLPGISPSLAGRVIRFRNRLGGFVSSRQYAEVWGCSPRAGETLRKYTRVDSCLVKKIDINLCDFKELMRHPYGGYETAKAICRFREKFGRIRERDELRQAKIIPDSSYRKLYPYLKAD